MEPPTRKGSKPRRRTSGAVGGFVIGVVSILYLGSEGPKLVFYVGLALAVVLTAPWILSMVYVRTTRGRAARDEGLVRRRDEYLAKWDQQSHSHDDDQSE